MVPLRRTLVWSKVSFIFSAKAEDSLISSPIATVICDSANPCVSQTRPITTHTAQRHRPCGLPDILGAYAFQSLDFAQDPRDLVIVLALQLVQDRVAVLPFPVRRSGPKAAAAAVHAEVPVAAVGEGRVGVVAVSAAHAAWARAVLPPVLVAAAAVVALEERAAGIALVQRSRSKSVGWASQWPSRWKDDSQGRSSSLLPLRHAVCATGFNRLRSPREGNKGNSNSREAIVTYKEVFRDENRMRACVELGGWRDGPKAKDAG